MGGSQNKTIKKQLKEVCEISQSHGRWPSLKHLKQKVIPQWHLTSIIPCPGNFTIISHFGFGHNFISALDSVKSAALSPS